MALNIKINIIVGKTKFCFQKKNFYKFLMMLIISKNVPLPQKEKYLLENARIVQNKTDLKRPVESFRIQWQGFLFYYIIKFWKKIIC